MTSIRESVRRLFTPIQPLPPGVYQYQAPPDAPSPYRLHLRLEKDGSGILIVNAATVLHLNRTAAESAYYLVKGTPEEEAIRNLASRYRVSRQQAQQDYQYFVDRIQYLIATPDLDPESYLDFDRFAPYSREISAPYRLDCALTYRLSPGSDPMAAPVERVKQELSTEEWKTILDKAWAAGIPHIVFTGGEPTLRDDLTDLIARAEANGQVSGLLTDGLRLSEPNYLEALLQTGLDHLTLILRPDLEQPPPVLDALIAADLFVTVHVTLTPQNSTSASTLLKILADSGVKTISLSASQVGLGEALQATRREAADLGLNLVWDLPVPYSSIHPVALEIAEDAVFEGGGRAWLYVEPDGDVLPTQGINTVLGNMLTDAWETIWKVKQ